MMNGKHQSSQIEQVVTLEYSELVRPDFDLSDKIEKSYGPNGLGTYLLVYFK